MNVLEDLRIEVQTELEQGSPKLRAYVTALETSLAGAESDIKSHWLYYLAVMIVGALIGHAV